MALAGVDYIRRIWPDVKADGFCQDRYDALVRHLDKAFADVSATAPLATKTLDETLDLIDHMREAANAPAAALANMSRQTLVAYLKGKLQQNVEDDYIVNTVCLCLSLWLTMKIVPPEKQKVGLTDTKQLEWSNDSTLADAIARAFPRILNPQVGKISDQMTAEYLEAYHRFRVVFTDNLSDHLHITYGNMTSRKPAIMIYQHKVFLWNELYLKQVSPLPRELVEEVLDTLNILLPHGDTHTMDFLDDRGMHDFYALGTCNRQPCRDLSRYLYFGNRLAQLSVMADSPLTGINQVLPGRGLVNFKDSATFCVTVIVITILTVASIVLGALSYDVSKKSLILADQQYRLSLAQACATMNSTQLPDWCP